MIAFIAPYTSSVVNIGSVPLGGDHPIRLQSMTNTDTLDTGASVAQCIRIIEAGADYVRLTAQGIREAENLGVIKKELRRAGFKTPLIADIHFNPLAAEKAARLVEKVRINPGNYAEKRASFSSLELTEKEYDEELERTYEKLLPLIIICKEHQTAIRIGINHGSLSDRIMTRYGNTPAGMVQSAMEFISIFKNENFNDLVLSMKSSDTAIMVESTRLLVSKMQQKALSYPIHLGVTEAGEGEDGRIRSAAGIGALLADGIGDTIRVSLSEDPEKELPVAQKLVNYYPRGTSGLKQDKSLITKIHLSKPVVFGKISGPIVVSDLTSHQKTNEEAYSAAGFNVNNHEINRTDESADLILMKDIPEIIPEAAFLAVPHEKWLGVKEYGNIFPAFNPDTYAGYAERSDKLNIILTGPDFRIEQFKSPGPAEFLIFFTYDNEKERLAPDIFLNALNTNNLNNNIILNPVFNEDDPEDLQIKSAALLGKYIIDNHVAGISVTNTSKAGSEDLTRLAFSILQSTGKRLTRTVYLSCPTCGRTKFNLPATVKKVKDATGHLKGLKIAIMGCIVNGPGEMADADYGYVGAAPGKVHIYKGTKPVMKNVPEQDAVRELLRVIEADRK